jgi:micrococcal nuclease
LLRLFFKLLLLIVVSTACSPADITKELTTANEPTEENSEFERVEVELIHPVDGDTIAVNYQGEEKNVRFLLVDSPETNHPQLGEQPFGRKAKEYTSSIMKKAKEIELEFDIGPQKDKYGRLLAYVYVDGKLLQEELLKQGLARVAYIFPPNTRYVDQFKDIQKNAQQQGIGIWQVENYVQEDGFNPEALDETETKKETHPTQSCLIKGNISSEKIYHTPDSPWYEQTKAEVMFCTEQEAINAGFRAPREN